jgi:antitoxin component of MazEF toxin-antitoxin module
MEDKENNRFVITKRIAKHGNQAVIVIPKILEDKLKPGVIAQLTIDVVGREE